MSLWFASSLLLAAHLLAVNLASGGPLVAAWLLGRSEADANLGARLLRWSLATLAIGSLLGGVTLLLPGLGLREAFGRFPAKAYMWAGLELLFSAACILAMLAWRGWFRRHAVAAWLMALVASTNLLYHFLPWLAVIGRMAVDPTWGPRGVIDRKQLLQLMGGSEPMSLSAHVVLASLVVPALAALATFRRESKLAELPTADGRVRTARGLAMWALVPTVLQLPVGAWVLVGVTPAIRTAAMGGDPLAAVCFAAGVAAALYFTQVLAGLALGELEPRGIRRAGWLLVVTVTLMTGTLRAGRMAAQRPSPGRPAAATAWPSPTITKCPTALHAASAPAGSRPSAAGDGCRAA
ncbi:MAG: hypothetical protein KF688_16840 [Pirellulales bacterium]|nr:hypothetical protein [Pirellulales bacterium]